MLKKSILFLMVLVSAGFVFSANRNQDRKKNAKGTILPAPQIVRSKKAAILPKSNSSVLLKEEFETGGAFWTSNGCWAIGSPSNGPNSGHNSNNCAATSLNGDYDNNADDWLISSTITLPEISGPDSYIRLYFWEWFAMESGYDYGKVMVSTDGGSHWIGLDSRDGSSGWQETMIDLTTFAGKTIKIAFHFISDNTNQYEGWYIDDLQIDLEQPEPLSATMVSLNHQNFPFIYMNVAVDTFGVGFPNLTKANFQIYENNVLQTDYLNVIPPETGGGSRLTDIVFLMDNSGSMAEEQNAVRNNVIDFVNNLRLAGVDFALGLCRYGQDADNGNPYMEDDGQLTKDIGYFQNTLWARNVVDGGTEPGYYAITQAANIFSFRPGAQKVFIIITDETPDQGGATLDNTVSACANNSITLFALTEPDLYNTFEPITSATNGEYFDIYSNFDDILDYISSQVANTFLIRYSSSDPVKNGIERNVNVIVNYNGNQGIAMGSYIPGSTPIITRTQNTLNLHNRAWAQGTRFSIETEIIDDIAPFVQSATLYFKNTSTASYQSVSMTNTGGIIWEGIIDGAFVKTPGVDYYISASDGQNSVSSPSVDPINNPYQIAILPNVAPQITHTPVTTLSPNTAITISANIVDNTNSLEGVKLYYRKTGQLIYQNVDMINISADNYEAEIPASFVTNDGVDYYIKAWDDFGVSGYSGTADNPYQIFLPLDVKLLLLSSNPNPDEQKIMEGGIAHRYYKIIDVAGNPIENVILEYKFVGQNKSYFSLPSNNNGLIDLYINIGGGNKNTAQDDWLRAGNSVKVDVINAKKAGSSLNIIDNQIPQFLLTVEDRKYKRNWSILLGPEIGVGGTAGSIGVGPLGVAAAEASVRAKGGLGYDISVLKSSTQGDKVMVSRRAEAGIGGQLSIGKITAVANFRVGAEANGTAVFRGEQSYLFSNPESEDEKMAQAGLLLETLAIGNVPVSPALGLLSLAIINVLNRTSGADQIIEENKYSTSLQGGFEGSLGVGFKTELISNAFSRIINIKLPNAEANLGFYLGLDQYYQSQLNRILMLRKYLQDYGFSDTKYKIFLQEAGSFDISILNLDIDNGLPFNIEANFLPHIGRRGLFEQAAFFDENWNFQGIELTFESDATELYSAVDHDIERSSLSIPKNVINAFLNEAETNLSELAIAGNSSSAPLGYANIGIDALTNDCAQIISNSILKVNGLDENINYAKTDNDASIYEAKPGVDLHLALGAGISVFIGANFKYIDSKEFLNESGKFVSPEHGFLEMSSYTEDNYVDTDVKLTPIIENMISGIWPLVKDAFMNLLDWVNTVIKDGLKWDVGWWQNNGETFIAKSANSSLVKLSGKGNELPDNSKLQITRYSPQLSVSNSFKQAYKSNRITIQKQNKKVLSTGGLIVGIGKCYQISAEDQYHNEILTFQDSCELKFRVSDKEILDSGFRLADKENVRIYEYIQSTNSWSAVSSSLKDSDSLTANISEMGTYMLGIEFKDDSVRPSFGDIIPAPNSTIPENTIISITAEDEGSGIDILRTQVMIDAINYPVSWDSSRSILYVNSKFLRTLTKGKHHLFIKIYDRAGNHNEIEYNFILGKPAGSENYFYPNPFNPDKRLGTMQYILKKPGDITIKIYDAANVLVRTLIEDMPQDAEVELSESWDGRDDNGNVVANGIYFYVIESSAGERAVGKIAVIR